MGKWLVPFDGRNHSTSVKLNFLWNEGPIFIMDNHRAAMWCWLDFAKGVDHFGLFHVDRHYDALYSEKDYRHIPLDSLDDMKIEEYLSLGYDNEFFAVTPVFRWDNYLGLFIERYRNKIASLITATHEKGCEPVGEGLAKCFPWEFPVVLTQLNGDWIFNLDLDYFCTRNSDGEMVQMVTDSYIVEFATALSRQIENKIIRVLTISLSPECSGGWSGAEKIIKLVCSGLNINFVLPE